MTETPADEQQEPTGAAPTPDAPVEAAPATPEAA
ncbi:MAG: hypothetical protein QOE28_1063, partial [Solirubrobacteraceae bacterium]|nr:hypothetical protein [Solirubrobacteraceae bacterium]